MNFELLARMCFSQPPWGSASASNHICNERLSLTFPHGHLSTASHSNPTHLQEEPGSSFSASNTAPSCQVKGGRVTFLLPHSIPTTTGLAALAQPSLTPSRNYTQGFSHLTPKATNFSALAQVMTPQTKFSTYVVQD